jgi:hypothetical protein
MIPQPAQPSPGSSLPAGGRDSITSEELLAWVASRGRVRARIKALCLTVLVLGVGSVAVIWTFFHGQLLAIAHVKGLGFEVDWELNKANFLTGGTTSVSMPFRHGVSVQLSRQDFESISTLPHVVSLDLSTIGRLQDDDLAFLSKLEDLTTLALDRPRVSGANTFGPQTLSRLNDGALKHIRGLKKLSSLSLSHNGITDAGLESLQGLQALNTLELANNPITDEGLKKLAKLQALGTLDLEGTQVTSAGLDALKGLKKLKFIRVENTAITIDNSVQFQTERPDVAIDRDYSAEPRGR